MNLNTLGTFLAILFIIIQDFKAKIFRYLELITLLIILIINNQPSNYNHLFGNILTTVANLMILIGFTVLIKKLLSKDIKPDKQKIIDEETK